MRLSTMGIPKQYLYTYAQALQPVAGRAVAKWKPKLPSTKLESTAKELLSIFYI